MAETCKICGAEINVFQTQKLSDGNAICRKNCRSKGFRTFDYVHATLPQVTAHLKQVEQGTKLWEHYFAPRQKEKDQTKMRRFCSNLYVAEDLGLMAVTQVDYKFFLFGKSVRACVYRIADLISYNLEEIEEKTNNGVEKKSVIRFSFTNTDGMYEFILPVNNNKAFDSICKYFDGLFGIQKTLGNAMNNWSRQKDALKSVAAGMKATINGAENAAEQAADAAAALDTAIYGDRTKLIQRADAALSSFRG